MRAACLELDLAWNLGGVILIKTNNYHRGRLEGNDFL